jgi:hypothetical protein
MPNPLIHPIVSVADGFIAVGVVSTQILPVNPSRGDADIVNDSDNVVYLARGNAAVVGSGIRLNPNGGSYHIGTNNMFYGIVNGISLVADSNVTVSEGSE